MGAMTCQACGQPLSPDRRPWAQPGHALGAYLPDIGWVCHPCRRAGLADAEEASGEHDPRGTG